MDFASTYGNPSWIFDFSRKAKFIPLFRSKTKGLYCSTFLLPNICPVFFVNNFLMNNER